MNARYKKLFIFTMFSLLLSACNKHPTITSATADKIITRSQPEDFTDAYHLAQKECQKNTRNAEYVSNENNDLNILEFNCVDLQTGTETNTETTEPETETSPEES